VNPEPITQAPQPLQALGQTSRSLCHGAAPTAAALSPTPDPERELVAAATGHVVEERVGTGVGVVLLASVGCGWRQNETADVCGDSLDAATFAYQSIMALLGYSMRM
jgi:hypothetical protein